MFEHGSHKNRGDDNDNIKIKMDCNYYAAGFFEL
jgi:hypothetical protein